MPRNKKVLEYAEEIVSFREYQPKANPSCHYCKGKGEREEQSHHNGDYYMTTCECTQRNRPVVDVSEWDQELLIMAKHYIDCH